MAWRKAVGLLTMVSGQFVHQVLPQSFDIGIPGITMDLGMGVPLVQSGMNLGMDLMDLGMFPPGRTINLDDPFERLNPYSLDHSPHAVCCHPGEKCDGRVSHPYDAGVKLSVDDEKLLQQAFTQASQGLQFVAEKLSYETHRSQHYLDVFNGIFRSAFGMHYKIENLQGDILDHLIGTLELMRARPSMVGYSRAHPECCHVGMPFNAVAGVVGKDGKRGWNVYVCPKFYRATHEWSLDNSKPAHILQQFLSHWFTDMSVGQTSKLMHAEVFKDFVTRVLLSFPPPRQPLGIFLSRQNTVGPAPSHQSPSVQQSAQDEVPEHEQPAPSEFAPSEFAPSEFAPKQDFQLPNH